MAEVELEQNLNRTFRSFFRASDEVRGVGGRMGGKQEGGAAGVQIPRWLPWEDGGIGDVRVWE